jgi:ATP-dependent helicase HrpA
VLAAALADIRAQLGALVYPGFIADTGADRLPDLVRYLRAISHRLAKSPADPARDADRMAAVHRVQDAWREALAELGLAGRLDADARAVRWMIEELRVSLFAQTVGTPIRVSEQRVQAAVDRLLHWPRPAG